MGDGVTGYVPRRNKLTLRFSGDLEGLVCEVWDISAEQWMNLYALADLADADQTKSPTPEQIAELRTAVECMGRALISWNVETSSGDPVPATAAGIVRQGLPFVTELLTTWMDSLVKPDEPQEQLPAAPMDIPMDILG